MGVTYICVLKCVAFISDLSVNLNILSYSTVLKYIFHKDWRILCTFMCTLLVQRWLVIPADRQARYRL